MQQFPALNPGRLNKALRENKIKLNGKTVVDDIPADMLLIDFVRAHGCKSVKRGCETSACGLCTVMLDDVPVLSCSTLAARATVAASTRWRPAGRGIGVRGLHRRPGRRAVRFLQPRLP